MSRYTVTWHPDAESDLAELWMAAPDRREITSAVKAVDAALSTDAEVKGASVAEGLRSFNAPPIRVLFVVRADDRTAEVQLVRRI